MSSDLLVELLDELDRPQTRYNMLERYYSGAQPLSFLSPEAKVALPQFARMVSNIPRLAVSSLAERLRITGFSGADVFADWIREDMDQRAPLLHRDVLALGESYVIVWADEVGRPRISVESAHQVSVLRDPASREVTSAVKRWCDDRRTYAVLYLPGRIERWEANTAAAANTSLKLVQTIDNPIGIPVVPFVNADRVLGCGVSEIEDLMPLVDGLAKVLTDMMVTAEYVGQPRRWATGIQLVEKPVLDTEGNPTGEMETVSPIPEGDRLMTAEEAEARFGQLPAADLRGYENAVNVLLGQIMAVSALPAHYVGIMHDNPASADAIRSAEASLTARAEARQQVFGRSWEAVARLIVAVRDAVDPASVDVRVRWADASTRSTAAEADAAVKLHAEGILSRATVLRRMGLSDDEIAEELRRIAAEASPNTTPTQNGAENAAQSEELTDE